MIQRIAQVKDEPKPAPPATNGDKKPAAAVAKAVEIESSKASKSPELGGGKEMHDGKKSQKKLYHLRHKLQKLVYERKEVSMMDGTGAETPAFNLTKLKCYQIAGGDHAGRLYQD